MKQSTVIALASQKFPKLQNSAFQNEMINSVTKDGEETKNTKASFIVASHL